MKYTIARSIAMLFLVLDTKPLSEGIGINNYSRLINDIHRYYRTSCIIFVRSGNCDLHTTTLVHMWSREFSRQQVMTMTTTFSDLTSNYNEYQENVTRPLFVVLFDTRETMDEFAKTTRAIKPISFPIWFVVFLQRPGNSLEEHCWYPTDNIFNVDVRTEMLVLCYDRPTLVEWYAIRDNRTRTFDLATWSPDNGLILKTQKNLYARRSDMFGEVVRVVLVENSPLVSLENGTLGGFLGLVLTELTKAMNFSVEILDPVEGFGGWSHQQKIWTGAIGQLVINKADIGVSAFTMTTRRRNVIDFTMPLVRSRYRLYFKEPEQATVQWNLYLQTLDSFCQMLIFTKKMTFHSHSLVHLKNNIKYLYVNRVSVKETDHVDFIYQVAKPNCCTQNNSNFSTFDNSKIIEPHTKFTNYEDFKERTYKLLHTPPTRSSDLITKYMNHLLLNYINIEFYKACYPIRVTIPKKCGYYNVERIWAQKSDDQWFILWDKKNLNSDAVCFEESVEIEISCKLSSTERIDNLG
ncbi:PREDICTED: uncharacterized protein LOC105448099 [Wasmannia auropunctata]|uniref:uncharacterized protein LOC105448099 n=1 Tax=Wasmannia auropunctata TaxID=64793 RepID=UPI0005EDB3F7|nr:PREDICTED: uncharacterized protein LOC105448099 [Wasmannia auropunctata]